MTLDEAKRRVLDAAFDNEADAARLESGDDLQRAEARTLRADAEAFRALLSALGEPTAEAREGDDMSNLPTLYVPDEEIYQLEPGQARPWAYVTRGEAERADAGKVHEYVPASRLAEVERERDEWKRRAERAEAFIESLSTGRAGTANRCTGIACTDPDYGDIACMRLAGHEGDHVALCGEALAADLDDARAALARVTKERDEAHSLVSSGIAQVDGLRITLTAARERVKALVALLVRARQVVVALYDGRDTDDGLLARIDAATGEK